MSRYKELGQDPGGTGRYYHKGGLGAYTFVWCGGCMHTTEVCNVIQAREDGWRKRKGWGWLCGDCLERLNLN